GLTVAVLSEGCARAWSPRVLRSAQGAHFSLHIHEDADLAALARELAMPLYATGLGPDTVSLYDAVLEAPCVWIAGNEGQGVDADLFAQAAQVIHIPQDDQVESLNVAATTGTVLVERRRRALNRAPRMGDSERTPVKPDLVQHLGGEFFYGLGGRRQPGDAFHAHEALGIGDLLATLPDVCVGALGASFVADFAQAHRVNRQAKKLASKGRQGGGQAVAIKVFGNQRIVGCPDGVLHGQVQAGGRLAAARHANQDDVGLFKPMDKLAVVVRQRKVDGLDAPLVVFDLACGVGAPDKIAGFDAQCRFDMRNKGAKQVHQYAVCLAD